MNLENVCFWIEILKNLSIVSENDSILWRTDNHGIRCGLGLMEVVSSLGSKYLDISIFGSKIAHFGVKILIVTNDKQW